MNWKRIAVGAASGGAILAGLSFGAWAITDALMHLTELQMFVIGVAGVGAGGLGIRYAGKGE